MPDVANTPTDFLTQSLAYVRAGRPDMTIRQLAILAAIIDPDGPRKVKDIAEYLRVSKPVVTRAAQTLALMGYASRKPCEVDRRDVRIFPTADGFDFSRALSKDAR